MFKKKNELSVSLFDKAMEWYQSGNPGKKEAAIELFPEDMLEKEIDNYKRRNKKERKILREIELKNVLERAKKMFPIGTLVWSDDGTDGCPNLIIGEPYIGSTKYNTHIPYNKYEFDDNDRETVLVNTLRIFRNQVDDDNPLYKAKVGLEILLENYDNPNEYNKNPFIDLDDYHKTQAKKREDEIKRLKDNISHYKEMLDQQTEELAELEAYDPYGLNEDLIQEILQQHGRQLHKLHSGTTGQETA